jgi:hypothetical protein
MPRISKGPRLFKRKAKRKNGRLVANAVWSIRDGEREVATGIFAGEVERNRPKTPRKVYHLEVPAPASHPRY